jgi:hypothetical protein
MGDGLATGLASAPGDADGVPEAEAETHPAATNKLARGAATQYATFLRWWTAEIVQSPDIEQSPVERGDLSPRTIAGNPLTAPGSASEQPEHRQYYTAPEQGTRKHTMAA